MADKVVKTNDLGEVVPSSPFKPFSRKIKASKFEKEDIIEYIDVPEIIKTGEGKSDFYVDTKVVESSRLDRQKYINSFKNDVGLKNILKKVALTGKDIFEEAAAGRFSSSQGYVDISKMPDNLVDAHNSVVAGVNAFDGLSNDIKGKNSFSQFASMTNDEINKIIDAAVEAKLAAIKEMKEGSEDGK